MFWFIVSFFESNQLLLLQCNNDMNYHLYSGSPTSYFQFDSRLPCLENKAGNQILFGFKFEF